ncbi:MAG: hypothetical protein A3K19_04330 [Lentisphaerae bacterium RIFOXYB12_FULL_65_16]|nr:MAG: hypothetical protein A3K18_34800 [Lentisphaerae bacterium RIFOXYA12_64_32]OGV84548.1 MAG: hypothetical protein A3K19_04330 [Lentisphaerae bacterium RIFOXYB12_FULL_65_16]
MSNRDVPGVADCAAPANIRTGLSACEAGRSNNPMEERLMKKLAIVLAGGILIASLSSCESLSEHKGAATGAAVGTAAGAGLGYALGGKDNKGTATAIGAAAGAAAGGAAGHYGYDKKQEEKKAAEQKAQEQPK